MITANMVKELRESTGAGMLDCKKALTETNGNMEEAITWLREKGISKAAKKQTRIAQRINKLNKYYERPTELFARFIEGVKTMHLRFGCVLI